MQPDPTPPQRPLDLDAIRARADGRPYPASFTAASDIRLLLAEVTALRAELDAARAAWGEASEVAVDGLLRAEQRRSALADADHDGIDWGNHSPHPAARAERTEPATGEDDVEIVAETISVDATGFWAFNGEDVREKYRELARQLLAALDLPALRAALGEAERDRDYARSDALDWKRRCENVRAEAERLRRLSRHACEERDDYATRLKATDASWTQVAAERDQARDDLARAEKAHTAALEDVTRLLDEAREHVTEYERYVRVQHLYSGLHDTLGVNLTCKGCALLAATDTARQHRAGGGGEGE